MSLPTLLNYAAGVGSAISLVAFIVALYVWFQSRERERSVLESVKGQGIVHAESVVHVLKVFSTDETRLQALREVLGYDENRAEGVLTKVKSNVDLQKFSAISQSHLQKRLVIVGTYLMGFALIAGLTSTVTRRDKSSSAQVHSGPNASSNAGNSHGFSTDRDNPTKLRTNEIRGTGVDKKRVRYYFSFLGGPGEVRVTLDFTSGGMAQGAYATLFDQDFVKIDGITMILNRGDSERKVAHIQLSGKQMVIVELDLEGNEVSSAGSFLLRVEGAVEFQ